MFSDAIGLHFLGQNILEKRRPLSIDDISIGAETFGLLTLARMQQNQRLSYLVLSALCQPADGNTRYYSFYYYVEIKGHSTYHVSFYYFPTIIYPREDKNHNVWFRFSGSDDLMVQWLNCWAKF